MECVLPWTVQACIARISRRGVTWMSKSVCNAYIAATKLARTVMFNGSETSGPLTTGRAR